MRWVRHVACTGEGRGEMYTGFWWGNLNEWDHFEGQGVDEGIILK